MYGNEFGSVVGKSFTDILAINIFSLKWMKRKSCSIGLGRMCCRIFADKSVSCTIDDRDKRIYTPRNFFCFKPFFICWKIFLIIFFKSIKLIILMSSSFYGMFMIMYTYIIHNKGNIAYFYDCLSLWRHSYRKIWTPDEKFSDGSKIFFVALCLIII